MRESYMIIACEEKQRKDKSILTICSATRQLTESGLHIFKFDLDIS